MLTRESQGSSAEGDAGFWSLQDAPQSACRAEQTNQQAESGRLRYRDSARILRALIPTE